MLAKPWCSAVWLLHILGCRCPQGVQERWLQHGCPQWLLLCISASAEDFWYPTQRMPVSPLLGACRDPSCMMPASHAMLLRVGHILDTGKNKCKGRGCSQDVGAAGLFSNPEAVSHKWQGTTGVLQRCLYIHKSDSSVAAQGPCCQMEKS